MNSVRLYAHIISELPVKMSEAGFSDGNLDRLLREIPRHDFGNPPSGLLRWLYLAYLGLAEFTLKPGIVHMFSGEKYWENELGEFQTPYHHKIHPDDQQFRWNMDFDIKRLTLHPAIPHNRHKIQITLKSALTSLEKSIPKKLIANYWHGTWLSLHQEFIPDKWKTLMREKKSRIIFPGVRLIAVPNIEGCPKKIQYPYLAVGTNGYTIEYKLDMQTTYNSTHETVSKKDYFVCFQE